MKFLILNTDYPEFLEWLYDKNPGLEQKFYHEQRQIRMQSLFGVADFYSRNLQKLGHEATDIHANNEFMQRAWARENGLRVKQAMAVSLQCQHTWQTVRHAMGGPLRCVGRLARPLLRLMNRNRHPTWIYDILAAQIKHYRPDVLLNQDMGVDSRFLSEMRPYIRLLVGQHAATPLPAEKDWNCYDLVISSFPPTVDFFRQRGFPSKLNRLGFEPEVLSRLTRDKSSFDITFVGSFHAVHKSRTRLLEALCLRFPQLKIWGTGVTSLPFASPIRKNYMGSAWGQQMYQILHNSKIVLNHHGDIAPYANNLRLFESTGVRALLLTDWKANLKDIFEPAEEVVAYRSAEECAGFLNYYLEHEEARAAIACNGQRRTLREHNYRDRMGEFVEIVRQYI